MDHFDMDDFRNDPQLVPLQAAVVSELLRQLEDTDATHLVMESEGGETRTVAMDTFIEGCRQRSRDLQRQIIRRN